MLYMPDYVINGGSIISVAGEIRALDRGEDFDPAWVEMKLAAPDGDPHRGDGPLQGRAPTGYTRWRAK